MRLAVLADIHANYTALEAVLLDAEKHNVDAYIIAGDHIGDGPQPKEVLNKIRQLKAWIIAGNREQYVIKYEAGELQDWETHDQMSAMVWTYKCLDKEDIKYIRQLPEQNVVNIPGTHPIRVVHGSPFDVYEHLYKERYPERLEKALAAISEPVMICGHTHGAWSKRINGKLAINPGSLGIHFNDSVSAEYAILTWDDTEWKVEHKLVKYDMTKLEKSFAESGLLKESPVWGKVSLLSIKTGTNIMVDFVKFAYKMAEEE